MYKNASAHARRVVSSPHASARTPAAAVAVRQLDGGCVHILLLDTRVGFQRSADEVVDSAVDSNALQRRGLIPANKAKLLGEGRHPLVRLEKLTFGQIALVRQQDAGKRAAVGQGHLAVDVILPPLQPLKRLFARDVKHHKSTGGLPVVVLRHVGKALLASNVPQLQLHCRVFIPLDFFQDKIHPNRCPVSSDEGSFHVSADQTGLPSSQVTHHNHLVNKLKMVGWKGGREGRVARVGGSLGGRRLVAVLPDRFQDADAMPDCDAKFSQVVIVQISQGGQVDVLFLKVGGELSEPEAFEPARQRRVVRVLLALRPRAPFASLFGLPFFSCLFSHDEAQQHAEERGV
mmetsp:Transcript_48275/g.121539  ORF Transcript_48275/g.121539 Transcript_48275/m.121539 type:complete len:346 (+) Transcript_48275:10-1047(+)